jgi:uncharacterized protein (DUF302 family)
MTAGDDDQLTEIASSLTFEATLSRLTAVIEGAGFTIFAVIDHAENARAVGLVMPPTTVIIYGNAKGGTPLMLAAPKLALDLPLRVLVREDASGTVVAFHPMQPILVQYGLPEAQWQRLNPAQKILGDAFKL